MNAEVAVKIIVLDAAVAMRHAVHGSGVHMSFVHDQDGPPAPAPPAAVDFFERRRGFGGQRFGIHMVGAVQPLAFEGFSGQHVLHRKGRAARNDLGTAVEPVQHLRDVFIVGGIIATLSELVASYILEAAMGNYMWDYTGYFMNFDSRIALVPGLMFGLLICVAICCIHPAIVRFQNKYRSSKIHKICFMIITALFVCDLISRIWLGSNFSG